MDNVFVYGMLLNQREARRFTTIHNMRPGTLRDYRIGFCGVATAVPEPGRMLNGAVLTVESVEAFDRLEGCFPERMEQGLYKRIQVVVDIPPTSCLAWLYIKNHFADSGCRSKAYYEMIESAYDHFGYDKTELLEAARWV